MSTPFFASAPLDPNLMTGPFRLDGSAFRMGAVVLGTAYGEFAKKLYVGTTGNVSLVCWDGTTVVLNSMVAGVWHDVCSVMVNSSGTTASNLVWAS